MARAFLLIAVPHEIGGAHLNGEVDEESLMPGISVKTLEFALPSYLSELSEPKQ